MSIKSYQFTQFGPLDESNAKVNIFSMNFQLDTETHYLIMKHKTKQQQQQQQQLKRKIKRKHRKWEKLIDFLYGTFRFFYN